MANKKGLAVGVGIAGLVGLGLLTRKAKTAEEEKAKPTPKPLTAKQKAVSLAIKYAKAFGVPPSLVLALLAVGGWREKGYVANSRGGAWGYSFITLTTAKDLTRRFPAIAAKYWPKFVRTESGAVLQDAAENIAMGAFQMSLQWKQLKRWMPSALSYYAGFGRLSKLLKDSGGMLPAKLPTDIGKTFAAYMRVRKSDPIVKQAVAKDGAAAVGEAPPEALMKVDQLAPLIDTAEKAQLAFTQTLKYTEAALRQLENASIMSVVTGIKKQLALNIRTTVSVVAKDRPKFPKTGPLPENLRRIAAAVLILAAQNLRDVDKHVKDKKYHLWPAFTASLTQILKQAATTAAKAAKEGAAAVTDALGWKGTLAVGGLIAGGLFIATR